MKRVFCILLLLGSACGREAARARAPASSTETRSAQISITEIRGTTPEKSGALFAPAHDDIEACRGASGGKVRVRVRTSPSGTLVVEAEPGSSLDPIARRCVLDALQGTTLVESVTGAGPVIKATGFTAIVTVEW